MLLFRKLPLVRECFISYFKIIVKFSCWAETRLLFILSIVSSLGMWLCYLEAQK